MLKELYEKIATENNDKISKSAHLAHLFVMPPSSFNILNDEISLNDSEVHLGFYNKDTKKVFTFQKNGNDIVFHPEEEIFQREEEDVQEINLDKIEIDLNKALEISKEIISTDYPDTTSLKTLIILQKLITYGFIWNITILRRDFKNVNLKIDAITGKVKSKSCEGLIDLNKSIQKKREEN